MTQTRVSDLAIQEGPGKPMKMKVQLYITYLEGPNGDHRGRRNENGGNSQVLVVSQDQLQKIWGGDHCVPNWLEGPIERGNILVEGMCFNEAYLLKVLKEFHVGDVLLEVTGLLRDREKNQIYGASCRVRQSGFVKIGDSVY